MIEGKLLRVPRASGFHKLLSKERGVSLISFMPTASLEDEYLVGDATKVSGLCKYYFLSSSGIVRGLVVSSPKIHTTQTPTMIRIGPCAGHFDVNQNLQKLGILMYESPDSSVILIPVNVKSPILVEVDT